MGPCMFRPCKAKVKHNCVKCVRGPSLPKQPLWSVARPVIYMLKSPHATAYTIQP